MFDYLVVGLGLAGISLCEKLQEQGKTYCVISDGSQTSSSVAGGLYNPVVLKRFTLAWKAKEQLEIATACYTRLEKKLNVKLDYKLSVWRRFSSVEEQNLWFAAADKIGLDTYLSPEIHQNINPKVNAPYGFGEVLHTGRIDTEKLLQYYANYLASKEILLKEHFDHKELRLAADSVSYKKIKAGTIVFAEGFGLRNNPYFNYLPLNGTKGEYVIIKSSSLNLAHAIKSSIFCIPLGEGLYKLGANYDRDDKTNTPTEKTKEKLLKKFETFVSCDYEVVDQVAGVRPTVIDRRPLLGQHPEQGNMFILNGFGSRGVLIAPFAAQKLYQHIETRQKLDSEMDIERFSKKYFKM